MDKRLIFPTNNDGNRDTFFVCEDRRFLEKKAAASYHPQVQKYIEKAVPIKDLVQVLLTALGAYEFWGQNVNGDRFRRDPLSNEGDDYGYRTFLTNANYFTHHVNKDPLLSKGKVLHSVWNQKANRVELVVGIDINKDPEAIAAMDNGETLSFSMGCRTPYDVCSICQNKAKTRAEYCDHAKYAMGQIDPGTGLQVGVDNPYPKFFDISRVLIPADKTAYMWTKVANAAGNPFKGIPSAFIAEATSSGGDLMKKIASYREEHGLDGKKTAAQKNATIIKRIPLKQDVSIQNIGERAAIVNRAADKLAPQLSKQALDDLSTLPIQQVLTTMAALAVPPTESEFARLFLPIVMPRQNLFMEQERIRDVMEKMFHPEHFNPSLAELFLPLIPYRSFYREPLRIRIAILTKKAEEGSLKIAGDEIKSILNHRVEPPAKVTGTGTMALAGIMAAAYMVMRKIFPQATADLSKVISQNPYLALAVGAGAIGALKGAQSLTGNTVTGMYDVDDPNREFYNNNWQSRFARLQARPVTVIKTAYARKTDTTLAKKIFLGVPAIFAGSTAVKARDEVHPEKSGPVSRFVADNPGLLSAGMLLEHHAGKPVSKHLEQALGSAKRLIKKATIDNEEFLSMLPEPDRSIASDMAILTNTVRMTDRLLGGK